MSEEQTPALARLLRSLKINPIAAIQDCEAQYHSALKSHNERLKQVIAVAVGFVTVLLEQPKTRTEFFELEWFGGGIRTPSDEKLPRWVMRYLLDCDEATGALYEQARSYAVIVQHFLDEGTEPNLVYEELSKATVTATRKLILAKRGKARGATQVTPEPARTSPKVNPGRDAQMDEPDEDQEDGSEDRLVHRRIPEDPDDDEGAAQPQIPTTALDDGEQTRRRPTVSPNRDVWFDAGQVMDRIVGTPEGDKVVVTLRNRGVKNGWIDFVAIEAKRIYPELPPFRGQ